ncbi:MAG: outer membrane protein assembly factor BamA [Desulfobacterales bacterium]|nr:outer membrane protein assembly factor BamA [Desulfobacterales bacterium]MDD4393258.1 outer membrane protein assembly factor BamA [Desulfobacterales bacterium]
MRGICQLIYKLRIPVAVVLLWGLSVAPYAMAGPADSAVEAVSAPVVSQIVITVDDSWGKARELTQMASELMVIRKGEPFSTERMEQSIAALKLCRRFQQIDVDSRDENGQMVLTVHLKPFQYIKDVRIHGKYPLFEKQILNAMTIYAGDVYDPDELNRPETLIAELYRRQGFIDPQIQVKAQQDSRDGQYEVDVYISGKDYLSLDSVQFQGNQTFSAGRLKMKMSIWRRGLRPWSAGRFIEDRLVADVKQLIQFYRQKGYAEVQIESRVESGPDSHQIRVLVTVNEGPLYRVNFSGNRQFWPRTLKKDLVLFDEGNRNNAGVRKSIRNIKERYQRAGYLDVRVTPKEEAVKEKGRTLRSVRFDIEEGPRSFVGTIQIEGNTAIDTEKIRKQMLTRLPGVFSNGIFDPQVLGEDLDAIRSLYRSSGFSDVTVVPTLQWTEDRTRVDIVVNIDERVQTRMSSVSITGLTAVPEADAYGVIKLVKGEPFRSYMVKSDENSLSALVSEQGYPHVAVKGRVSVTEDRLAARVEYQVNEGPRVNMGRTWFSGNFRTQERILENEIKLKDGEPFSLTRMLDSQRAVRNLNCMDSVRFKAIGLKEGDDTVNLVARVEEKKPYSIEFGGGYQSDKGIFAHGRAADRNLFGNNLDAWIGGETSQTGYRYDLSVSEPRLFGTRTSAGFSLYSERSAPFNLDFETLTYGGALNFGRAWPPHVNTGLNFRFEEREQKPDESADAAVDSDSDEQYEKRQVFTVTPSIRYDSRDSFVRPKKGIYSSLSVDVSKGIESEIDDFTRSRLDIRLYWSPFQRLTFAWLNRGGYIEPFGGSDQVPDDQLFYLGGTQDVRGFKENMLRVDSEGSSLGGRVSIAESLEARIDLGKNFEFTLFCDAGTVSDQFSDITAETIRSSVGLGLRYITPIGAMGFLYSVKLDRQENESAGRLHFSIGYTF